MINKQTKLGHSPLWVASYNGHIDVVRYLIEQAGANKTRPSSDGTSPFVISCQQGNLEIVKYLLREDTSNGTEVDEANCFAKACLNGHLSIVEYVFNEFPSVIEKTNYFGQSPIWLASQGGSYKIIEYLLEKGALIDVTTKNGEARKLMESPLIPSCRGMV